MSEPLPAYRWDPTVAPAAELRRIARAQVDRAIAELDLDDPDVAVHQVRKRAKKLRALLRLVRPVAAELYRAENPGIRDLGRGLSAARDDAAALGALEALAAEAGERLPAATLEAVEHGLSRAGGGTDPSAALERARVGLVELRSRIESDWTLPERLGGAAALAPGFRRSYAQGRDAFAGTLDRPTTVALHEWRKRVKDHGYHCRLLRAAWPRVMAARASALDELAERLGDDHDLAVLRAALQADPDRFGGEVDAHTTSALLDRRRSELQRDAVRLGRRVYTDRPKIMERRVASWWEVALTDAAAEPAGPLVEPGR